MNYIFLLIGAVILYYIYTLMSRKTSNEQQQQKQQQKQKRPLPFHLTSHRVSDNPCICEYVLDRLEEAGYPEKMTFEQIRVAYDQLRQDHPEYPYLLVG
jgi:hypothetical protein